MIIFPWSHATSTESSLDLPCLCCIFLANRHTICKLNQYQRILQPLESLKPICVTLFVMKRACQVTPLSPHTLARSTVSSMLISTLSLVLKASVKSVAQPIPIILHNEGKSLEVRLPALLWHADHNKEQWRLAQLLHGSIRKSHDSSLFKVYPC